MAIRCKTRKTRTFSQSMWMTVGKKARAVGKIKMKKEMKMKMRLTMKLKMKKMPEPLR